MEKVQLEFEMEKKMTETVITSKQQAAQIMMVERTRVMDKLYIQYGVKLVDLMRGFKKHNLEEDEDVKTQLSSIQAMAQEMAAKKQAELGMTEEQKKVLDEVVEGSGGKIDEMPNEDGILKYETFMKIFSALMRLSIRFTKEKNPDYLKKRRELLSVGKEKEYSLCIQDYLKKTNVMKTSILKELLTKFDVNPNLFNKSQRVYSMDPQHAPQFKKDAASFEHAEQRQDEGTELTKEDTLKYVEKVEEFKASVNAGMALGLSLQ